MMLSTALGGGATLASAPAMAQMAERPFDIPAQPLGDALMAFGRQSGLQVTAEGPLVEGRSSSAVSGRMPTTQALSQLLSGSGLTFRYVGTRAVRLERAPAAENDTIQLGPVRVEGNGNGQQGDGVARAEETATSPVTGYVVRRSATATKTDTPLLETPQSISVVTASEIRATGAVSIVEALGYSAGIARNQGTDKTTDSVFLRGFKVNSFGIYRDGLRYMSNTFDGIIEPYGLERLEVLRGAASLIYGSAAPGGIINAVTKRPTNEPLNEINLSLGSFGNQQVSGDFSNRITADGALSYRLTGLYRDSGTFIDHVPDNRIYIAPALKWEASNRTSLTLLGEYQKTHTIYTYGFPLAGTLQPNPNGPIARNRFAGEPDYDKHDAERFAAAYLLESHLQDNILLRSSLRYTKTAIDFDNSYPDTLQADGRTMTRGAAARRDWSSGFNSDNSIEAKVATGIVQHTLLVGVDYSVQNHETQRYYRTLTPIDLYAPVYGGTFGPKLPSFDAKYRTIRTGIYLQDQMKIADRWIFLVGARQDWIVSREQDVWNAPGRWSSESSDALTWRAGAVHLADNGLAPFVSFSQSFEPQSGTDRNGARFKPTRGEQFEAGLRYQPKGSNMLVTASVYSLTQDNVLATDAASPDFSVQNGRVRSRGFEFEAKAGIGANANVIAAYAYTDAKTVRTSPLTPHLDGLRTAGMPRHQASLWGDYRFGASGFRVGGGARYVGAVIGVTPRVSVPDYILFDAMAGYAIGRWDLSVNAVNVADRTYIVDCNFLCRYGEARRVTATLQYRW